MTPGRFLHRHRVRYAEVDPHNHVYNSRYLEFVDAALIEFQRSLGWDGEAAFEAGFDPLLARAEIDFHGPAAYDAELEIAVVPRRVGSSSLEIVFAIAEAGRPVAEASVRYVNVGADGRPRPIPDPVREQLEARLEPVGA